MKVGLLRPLIRMGSTRGWREREVAALGADQRLLVATWQLRALGISPSAVQRAVGSGRLHRYGREVHALVPPAALPPLAAEQAAVLVCRGGVISHRSAAVLWELIELEPGPVSVTLIGSDRGRGRAELDFHRVSELDRRDVRRCRRLPVTAPARTLIDLAALSSTRQTELALDRALTRHLTSRSAIREAIARAPRRAGIARLRPLLDPSRRLSVTMSAPEETLRDLLRRGGLPEFEANVPIGDPHSARPLERYRPDAMWREQRVVVEYDGRAHHSGAKATADDRRRDAEMIRAGWTVIRLRAHDLNGRPDQVLVRIAGALARGGWSTPA